MQVTREIHVADFINVVSFQATSWQYRDVSRSVSLLSLSPFAMHWHRLLAKRSDAGGFLCVTVVLNAFHQSLPGTYLSGVYVPGHYILNTKSLLPLRNATSRTLNNIVGPTIDYTHH